MSSSSSYKNIRKGLNLASKVLNSNQHVFLGTPSEKVHKKIKSALKLLYDNILQKEKPISELYVSDDLDEEQIWQQLELLNNSLYSKSSLKKLKTSCDTLADSMTLIEEFDDEDEDSLLDTSLPQIVSSDEEDASDAELLAALDEEIAKTGLTDKVHDEPDETNFFEDGDELQPQAKRAKNSKESIVDDEFFQLSEMEKFLDDEDKLEMNEEVDANEEMEEDEVEDEESENPYMYQDFFDPVPVLWKEDAKPAEKKETTKFEKKQEILQNQIQALENENISEKPWFLKGEVKSSDRPADSLLSEYLEFEHTTRPAPLITQETTETLESLIEKRIKDNAFDNVTRILPSSSNPQEYKKEVVLDQQKSEFSLAEIYERQFLTKNQEKDGKEDAKHGEIRKSMESLFRQFDLLYDLRITPRAIVNKDIKIVPNDGALSVEDAVPEFATDASLLAPQEIKKPVVQLTGKAERSKQDKLRERRQKKVRQRKKHADKKIDTSNHDK